MYALSFFDGSNFIFYALIIILIAISIAICYLVYTQNKQTREELMKKHIFIDTDKRVNLESIADVEDLSIENEAVILEPTVLDLTEKLESSNSLDFSEFEELQSITKELEKLPKEKKIKLTPYEEEQEEKAIISYDELVNHNVFSSTDNRSFNEKEINNSEKIEITRKNYIHEESFLKELKQLEESLD